MVQDRPSQNDRPPITHTGADETSETRFGPRPVPEGHRHPAGPSESRRIPPHGDVSPDGSRVWPRPSPTAKWLVWGGTALAAAAVTAGTVIVARQLLDAATGPKRKDEPERAVAPPVPRPFKPSPCLPMPAANLLALLDDIASVLDDVAAFSKLAAKKTAGVLGDDLALNAQQVAGVQASRELPVIWAVARGSFVNKAVLVPAALVISAFAPMLVTPLLMVGGTYLCFEGFEKVSHRLLHRGTGDGEHAEDDAEQAEAVVARVLAEPAADPMVLERDKIKGAIRTDFILSAEIIIIALGTVAAAPLLTRIGVLTAVAMLMTVAVYGFVGMIIKLDDLGWWLQRRGGRLAELAGGILLGTAPRLMRFLTVAGTAAMFLVGGGIMVHGVPVLAHSLEALVAPLGPLVGPIATMVGNALAGVVVGAIALAAVALVTSVRRALAR